MPAESKKREMERRESPGGSRIERRGRKEERHGARRSVERGEEGGAEKSRRKLRSGSADRPRSQIGREENEFRGRVRGSWEREGGRKVRRPMAEGRERKVVLVFFYDLNVAI